MDILLREMRYIYGPVPSRRLGYSLGVDVVPHKTCSLNCVYCQLGRTTNLTVRRRAFRPANEILSELRQALAQRNRTDFITFSGSGEPTLHSQIGLMICEIRRMSPIPVAVLTNGTLLFRRSVRAGLRAADIVLPSLDAASPQVFKRLNRPHPSLSIGAIIDGLVEFRNEFDGQIWLEILLVRGLNDADSEIAALKAPIARIQPDEVHLNTVTRPPAVSGAEPVPLTRLQGIRRELGDTCHIIAEFENASEITGAEVTEEVILALIRRRPVTLLDVASALGIHPNEAIKHLERLVGERRIRARTHVGKIFFYA